MRNTLCLLLLGKKGLAIVRSIADSDKATIARVVVGSDRAVVNDYSSDIRSCCEEKGIECESVGNLQSILNDHDGYVLAIGWRWLVPVEENRLIIIHDSLLPKYRGFAPLVNCLIKGESRIGATAIFGAERYDEGDIILQKSRAISYPMKIEDAIDLMSGIYIDIFSDILSMIREGRSISGQSQSEVQASYSLWRDEEDYWINWTRSAAEIERFVNAVGFPYGGARCVVDGVSANVFGAESVADVAIEDRGPSIGKVIRVDGGHNPVVVCGVGLVRITEMVDSVGNSLLPLKHFRVRFLSKRPCA